MKRVSFRLVPWPFLAFLGLFLGHEYVLPVTPQPPQRVQNPPENENPPKTAPHVDGSFLPLAVGNRWTYDVELNGKKRPRPLVIEITKVVLANFRTYYVFNRFPFAPGPEDEVPIIRYDRRLQKFFQLLKDKDKEKEKEVELYPVDGENRVVVQPEEASENEPGRQTLKVRFPPFVSFAPQGSGSPAVNEVVLQYHIGVVAATLTTSVGVEKFTLIKTAENANPTANRSTPKGPVTHEEPPELKVIPSPYAASGPTLELSVETAEPGKMKFFLRAKNMQDKIVPLQFNNDQTFDFVVTSTSSSEPVWKWSTTHTFAKVKRSLALLPGEVMEFSASWDGFNTDHQMVPADKYTLVAILTTSPELKTPPTEFTYTPAPPQ